MTEAFIARCPCGASYTLRGWEMLEPAAAGLIQKGDSFAEDLELRNCFGCGSTRALELPELTKLRREAALARRVIHPAPIYAGFATADAGEQDRLALKTVQVVRDLETNDQARAQLTHAAELLEEQITRNAVIHVAEGECIFCEERIVEETDDEDARPYESHGEVLRRWCECGATGRAAVDRDHGDFHLAQDKAEERRAEEARDIAVTKLRGLLAGKPTNEKLEQAFVLLSKINYSIE